MPESDALYAERVAMQRRLDELFPRGLSLEVVDMVTISGVPLQTGILSPCGRVFCAEMLKRPGDEPDIYLLRFDLTPRIDPDPWVEDGRPWQAWTDGRIIDAGSVTRRMNTYMMAVLDQDGDPVGWTAYLDADPPQWGPGPRVVRSVYRRYATERWLDDLFPRGLEIADA